jgi:plasmid stabilization system protein ParE
MARKINWTPQAQKDLADLLQYLSEAWSHQVVSDFTHELEAQVNVLTIFRSLVYNQEKIHWSEKC